MDLSVVFCKKGRLDMQRSFDVGAGPSAGIEDLLRRLSDLVEDGEADASAVERASWLADWERILLSDETVPGWSRDGIETVTALCERDELGRILAASEALRPAVAELGATAKWDAFVAFLTECHAQGGTIALWCDLEG
jgi:hypothetical protein